jgi:hypothetical protein
MQPIVVRVELATAVADGIAEAQTLAGAGDVELAGTLVSDDGVAILTDTGVARQVIITSTGTDTGVTFTIYGTDATGVPFSEAVTGADAGVATSVGHYHTVTRIAASGATDGDIEVGTNGVGSSQMVNLDYNVSPYAIGLGCVVSGTVNYTVQHTFANIYALDYDPVSYVWFANSDLTGKTANAEGAMTIPSVAVRILLNSGSGTVEMTVLQASPSP